MEPATLSEAIDNLRTEGYTIDFNLTATGTGYAQEVLKTHPDKFSIDKFYRFEGNTDPEDEAIVYALSAPGYHLKGFLVNAFGIYSDPDADQLISAVKEKY